MRRIRARVVAVQGPRHSRWGFRDLQNGSTAAAAMMCMTMSVVRCGAAVAYLSSLRPLAVQPTAASPRPLSPGCQLRVHNTVRLERGALRIF